MQTILVSAIRKELLAAKKLNPNFSLRAMARRLRLSSGALAELLQGSRHLSPKITERVCHQLAVREEDRRKILQEAQGAKRRKRPTQPVKYSRLSLDQFEIMADLEHFYLLSLLKTKDFRSNEEWMAKRLGISKEKVSRALARLERLGLIEKNSAGEWKRTGRSLATPDEIANASLRHANRRAMEKAIEVQDLAPPSERDLTTYITVGSPSQLALVKRAIRDFQDYLSEVLEQGTKEEVYQLTIQFVKVTRAEGKYEI